jgi:biotin-[acetyl-CoA-carboxylase] ligase BirA-like protein
LVRPDPVPPASRGWLPLLAGVAVVHALGQVSGLDARLKWPNDVLAGDRKLAGILAEQAAGAVVVGIGVNVLGAEADLPVATATSLERCGAGETDRTSLLAAILDEFELWYLRWRETGRGDAEAAGLRKEYLSLSATVGRQVRVELPGDRVLAGLASGVDGAGQLLIEPAADADVSGVPVAGAWRGPGPGGPGPLAPAGWPGPGRGQRGRWQPCPRGGLVLRRRARCGGAVRTWRSQAHRDQRRYRSLLTELAAIMDMCQAQTR